MKRQNMTRIIHTGLYGNKAREMIDAVHGQLSDGMWENTRGSEKYWTNFNVETAPDGEILFKLNADSYIYWSMRYYDNPFVNMSDDKFKCWFARKLKAVITAEIKDSHLSKSEWRRDNTTFTSSYLNYKLTVTVADIYCVYDHLLGRKTRSAIAAQVIGEKLSSTETAKVKANREAAEKLIDDFNKRAAELKKRKEAELKAVEEAYDKNREKAWNETKDLFKAKFGNEWEKYLYV